jgi:sortase B
MGRSWTKWAAMFLALMSLGIAAFFAGKIFVTEKEYKEGDDAYELIAQMAVTDQDEEPDESLAPSVSEDETEPVQNIDFDVLQEVNSQIQAWLYSPDTVINYPVVQGTDNQYYLYHLADGTYNRNGCLFIDWKNSPDFSDENTVIYGHHMASGKMFASLIQYASQDYFEAHPVMYLTVDGQAYRLELFAGYTTTADSTAYTLSFGSKHEFAQWLREVSSKSDFTTNMSLTTEDHIVTLSTCAYSFQDARYVVHGRLVAL